ncbi:methyl-accepting chemotaxis protein [Fodinisporobacter ferrooxydans]|uniref:Methyl-accepting chemotaxis protein n=1 Tax=Fodinisporobacter ferrooxydans TaxID=2901836 RepID=A0ABY4CLL1_9BACL|nr:methyl-accepting chemotaxis protein [Alicyclobacillaceae bacterium MYW30-H2]
MLKFTIGKKLVAGFASVLILLLVVSVIAIWNMYQMGNAAKAIQKNWMPNVKSLGQIQADFLNVERETLRFVLESDPNQMHQLAQKQQQFLNDLKAEQKQYEPLISSQEERSVYEAFKNKETYYLSQLPVIMSAGQHKDYTAANILAEQSSNDFEQALNNLQKDIQLNTKESDQATSRSVQLFQSGFTYIIFVSLFAIILGIVIVMLMSRLISVPIVKVSGIAEQIASGNLTVHEIKVKNRDEIGDLARVFNHMSHNLRELVQKVSMSAEQVAASSEQLLASSEQTTQATQQIAISVQEVVIGSQQQSSDIEKAAQTVHEMVEGVQQIAGSMQNMSRLAAKTSDVSSEGNQVIEKTIHQMNFIQTTVEEAQLSIKELGDHAGFIGVIVETITSIASQTNLLALNAAIEAARAGEHGRGFAVVADEVRKLSEESSKAARQITEYITIIKEGIDKVVESMEAGTKEVGAGIHIVNLAKQSFEEINQSVEEVVGKIQDASSATQSLSDGAEEIVLVMDQIAGIAESSISITQNVSAANEEQLASMEEITASTESLSMMALELNEQVSMFKI